ncbi:hypothetical protein [Adhaeribacter arboris]|uniref:hypothetical protein n=1 Tax=Adhaeribacter arboris TaxID=2072846 RepID=UPI001E37C180|nr:hypothetical protein [Adhaeribacter arboris]
MCILLTLINCGAILEQRAWVFYLEYSRVIFILFTIYMYHSYLIIPVVLLLYLVLSIVYFSRLKKTYYQYVYGLASC